MSLFTKLKIFADRNPVIAACWVMLGTGFLMPFTVVPIRQALGFKTNQYTKRYTITEQ
eukprot:gene2106-2296_t